MIKVSFKRHVALALISTVAWLCIADAPLRAQHVVTAPMWGNWPGAHDSPIQPQTEPVESAQTTEEDTAALDADQEASDDWLFVYNLWRWGIGSLSSLGPVSPIHGRIEVLTHADEIKRWAPANLQLIVAASIAHQASDFKDRPFGTDALETVWRDLVDDNISVGIAQLRQQEVLHWAPYLHGADLLTPETAIRIMAAKISQANAYILHTYAQVSDTDRFMLLALAQNTTSADAMRSTVDHFFMVAGGDWLKMLQSEEELAKNWRLQLRLVLIHLDWLVEQGWPIPDGIDLAYWSHVAFSTP